MKQRAPRVGLRTNGVKMKKLGVFLLATVGFAGFAHAADSANQEARAAGSAGELLREHLDVARTRRRPTVR